MALSEADIETPVCDYAKLTGWEYRKVKWDGRRGAFDRLFFKAPRCLVFIEFKAPRKSPRRLQEVEIGLWEDAGFTVHVVDDVEQGKRILDNAS